jgi:lipooligosaccharide transport system permease protein
MRFDLSMRFWTAWQRNWTVYLRTWKVSFLPPLFEPILYVAAFGVGFRALIGPVRYHGAEVSYVAFIAPALIASAIMNASFFETTYASYVRMYYQKTFDAMLATPLSLDEVIAGEIVWGATRSALATALMLAVLSAFGLIRLPEGLLILPVSVLGGIAFGALGMVFTALVKNIDMFTVPTFLFVTPMFLFSGTFFPLDGFPLWAQQLALVFPLTHLVNVVRGLAMTGATRVEMAAGVTYLLAAGAILFPLSLLAMRRRLVR